MATLFWIGADGSQAWNVGANWSTGSAPATGDDAYLTQGAADINSGLSNAGVTLNSLTIAPGFGGTVGVAGESGNSLAIGITTLIALGGSGSGLFGAAGITRFKWDAGSVAFTAVIDASGNSADAGRGTYQIKGGTSGSKLYVTGGSADVAAKPGETATLNLLDVANDAVVTCGPGLTCPTHNQNGENSTLTVQSAVTTLTQDAGTLNTLGSFLVATAKIAGTANFGHRPAGNAFTNLTVDPTGTANFSGDPRGVLLANAPVLYAGATLRAFNKGQLQLAGPASLQVSLVDCGLEDVTLGLGRGLTLTIS